MVRFTRKLVRVGCGFGRLEGVGHEMSQPDLDWSSCLGGLLRRQSHKNRQTRDGQGHDGGARPGAPVKADGCQ
jgi:hypothetical protein